MPHGLFAVQRMRELYRIFRKNAIFAAKIGLKREWFQDTNNPHYDVSKSHRKKAVLYGAVEITTRQAATMCRIRRETGKLGTLKEADEFLKERYVN